MNRSNLNYNYAYTLSPNSRERQPNSNNKAHSTTYITCNTKPQYQLDNNQHYNRPQSYTNYPLQASTGIKYYPISNDDQTSHNDENIKKSYNNVINSKLSQNESGSSFYMNTTNRQFTRTGDTLIKTITTTNNQQLSQIQMMITSPKSTKQKNKTNLVNNNNKNNYIYNNSNNNEFYTDNNNMTEQQQHQQHYQQQYRLNNGTQQQQKQQQQVLVNQHIEKYMNWLYQAFGQFERTGNVRILKDINQKNSIQTMKLFNQLYAQKENVNINSNIVINNNNNISATITTINNNSPQTTTPIQKQTINNNNITTTTTPKNNQLLFKLKQQIFQLQKQSTIIKQKLQQQYQLDKQLQQQLIQQIQIKQGHNLNQSQIRQQNHLKQMQQSIFQLEQQIKNLQKKNYQLYKNIIVLPFLKQWNLMFQEAKGATKLSLKLKHQIQKKQQLIKQLTNQDPSNNSDARSIRRSQNGRGSQNGDRSQSKFTKKQNKVFNTTNNDPAPIPKPMTPVRPISQISYKPNEKLQSGRSSNDVIIRHLSHSNRFSQSKKSNINNSVDRTKQRKQSYDQKQHINNQTTQWKGLAFPTNLKSFGVGFIGKDVYK